MGNACYRDEEEQTNDMEQSAVKKESSLSGKMQKKDPINGDTTQTIEGADMDVQDEEAELIQNETQDVEFEHSDNKDKKISMDSFKLLKVLGKGSFGKVMLVQHKATNQIYAMKVLLKQNIKNDRHKRHTQTERVILETAKNQFLVKLRYAFQSPYKLYLVVDYMPCGELFYHLRKVHRFAEEIAKFYAAEILLGLQYMHENNMIYRDLKPENILLDGEGHVKLTDFGLSKILEENDQSVFSLCGTPEYLAPEILNSKIGYDKNCDWWSYGALLYEMLIGAPPFYSENKKEMIRKILTQPIPYPHFLGSQAKHILSQLLVLDPKVRLGFKNDAQELMEHPFFESINFTLLAQRKIKPPYEFDKRELKFFDSVLTKQLPKDTPVAETMVKYQNFSNFTYVQKDFQSVAQQPIAPQK